MTGEKPVREECKERYILTIDYSREELMEYIESKMCKYK